MEKEGGSDLSGRNSRGEGIKAERRQIVGERRELKKSKGM